MTIYRGFEITKQNDGLFHATIDGVWIHKDRTEDAVMNWIDAWKRKQAALAKVA